MHEPSVRTSRLAIAGAFAAILAVGGCGFFLGRVTAPRPPAPAQTAAPAPAPVRPPVLVPETPKDLSRADLIALARQAADAFASGSALPDAVTGAAGRRFELPLPFGCDGPSEAGAKQPMQWRLGGKDNTLRVSAKPTEWTGADWGLDAESGIDAAEGFWIARPWSSAGACPAHGAPPAPDDDATPAAPLADETPDRILAIARFFRGPADRDGRRNGRAFETVQRIAAEGFSGAQGLRLLVSGRMEAIAAGAPVRCVQPAGAERRPVCVIGARIDTVRLENPANGEILATWTIGRSGQ